MIYDQALNNGHNMQSNQCWRRWRSMQPTTSDAVQR